MTTVIVAEEISARPPAALSVAVFCGATPGPWPATMAAREIGELLRRDSHRLVYGEAMAEVVNALAASR